MPDLLPKVGADREDGRLDADGDIPCTAVTGGAVLDLPCRTEILNSLETPHWEEPRSRPWLMM